MSKPIAHLNALRAFEAAARHESFAKAAAELHVSHTVISQHIKNLEQWLKTTLFERYGNRVSLTEAGRSFAPDISAAFQLIQKASENLNPGLCQKKLNIVTEPAFAARWLRRRLVGFQKQHTDIQVDLKTSWSPPDIQDSSTDIIIHFAENFKGAAPSPTRLFPIIGYPACAPALLEKSNFSFDDIYASKLPLIHDNGYDIWQAWFKKHLPGDEGWRSGVLYSDLSHAIDAALDGEGIILADNILLEREISEGKLVKLDDRTLECEWYVITTKSTPTQNTAMDLFFQWVLAA